MKPSLTTDSTLQNSKFAIMSAWIICPVVILFSYLPVLNIAARVVSLLLILWFLFSTVRDFKKSYWPAPLLMYLAWGLYTLLPSFFAPEPDQAMFKWFTIALLGLVNIAVANAVVWSGSVKPWIWAYLMASIASYYLPMDLFLPVDYEAEVKGRHVGTMGNANAYGCTIVQAVLLALILLLQETRLFVRMIILALLVIFTIEIIASGSRTAVVGLILSLLGAGYSVGIKSLLKPKNMLFFGLSMLATAITVLLGFTMVQLGGFSMIMGRMDLLLVYVGLSEGVTNTRERSLTDRMDLMETAFDTWLQYPLGVGLDNFKIFSGVYAHSNYFELLASVGLIGLLIYYFCYYKFYRLIMKKMVKLGSGSVPLQKMLLVVLVVIIAMDISHVSYYSKSLWLLLSILSGYLILLSRENVTPPINNRS